MVFKRTTIYSFYKKDTVVDVPREQGQNSSGFEEDEIANWLAA
jgi:predicted DNA-binding transcriptional regulator AlpA